MKYSLTLLALAAVASAHEFTSVYNITATPYEVVDKDGKSTPGPYGAKGQYNYAIDSNTDTICYDITLEGVEGDYCSSSKTATYIHEGAKGKSGPPRIAFPNPVGDDKRRHISGCLTGPFKTGVKGPDNKTDTGYGFKLCEIEKNPAMFFTDSYTVLYPAGVVRGQLDCKYDIIKKPTEYPTTKKDHAYETTKKPEPSKYPEHHEYSTTKKNEGHEMTTATITKTREITISKCKAEVTDCPYKTKPVVTKTYDVYTTVCPVSELTKHYPHSTEKPHKHQSTTKVYKTSYETITITKSGGNTKPYHTKTIVTEYPVHSTKAKHSKPASTYPVHETNRNGGIPSTPVQTYPVTKPVQTYPVQAPTTSLSSYVSTGTGYLKPSPTYTFTGGAGSRQVGGLLLGAGLVAALL